ncbi:MAG: hypothetical protein AAF500_03765 [Myxococcota bacterium]
MKRANARVRRVLSSLLVLPLFFGIAAPSCEYDVLEDPGFQFWCGDSLCEWETLEGEIQRVPTWHEEDAAVALIGSPVTLEQEFATGVRGCVLIELIADVDPGVSVTIAIDEDGVEPAEWEAEVDRSGFQRMSWRVDVDAPVEYEEADDPLNTDGAPRGAVRIQKTTPGHAVISQLRISKRCPG